ncbi:hypothetical protein HOA59_02865 [archaeon]|jgi:NOL1/NOP2/fmu family ribosome biogenesis protein|nr:hypothetical protein [archaeon]MBT6824352.1 hypothetical protein [archaeon]MBT7106902.1 hypothetical protein [archaeon]MBT7297455.1 hypothetical protein [archaeon]
MAKKHESGLRPIKSKELKVILGNISKQFGIESYKPDLYFFITKKNRVYIITRDYANFDLTNLRLNHTGIYFCTVEKDGVRMSIEGSQMVGKLAKKNVVEIDSDHLDLWVTGNDLWLDGNEGYVLIKSGGDFYGCGKGLSERIMNFIPKSRRIII